MALSPAKMEALAALVGAMPDRAMAQLERAFADAPGEAAAALANLVELERSDRRAAEAAFAPLAALLGRDPALGLTLPTDGVRRLWRALDVAHPEATDRLRHTAARRVLEGPDLTGFDALCVQAAELVDAGSGPDLGIAPERLATLLRLTPLLRRALEQLGEWLDRGTEGPALARLAYRDASKIGVEGGPLFLETLAAHLGDRPPEVLNLASVVMGRPSDRYAAASELATFGERSLAAIEERLEALGALHAEAGPDAGRAAAEAVALAHAELTAFDSAFVLTTDGPWGERVGKLKRELAQAAELKIKGASKAVALALPVHAPRGGKTVRGHPRLDGPPDERDCLRAMTLTAFLTSLSTASEAGYGALRAKTLEALLAHVHQYIEDLVERAHAHEADEALARAYLDVAAGLYGWLTDERTERAVRRRAAAA